MHGKTGDYFKFNETGGRILELIGNPQTMEQIVERIQEEYNITEEQCQAEVSNFLEQLPESTLIVTNS